MTFPHAEPPAPVRPIQGDRAGGALALEVECERLSEELVRVSRRIEMLEGDREFLLAHARNLESELRRVSQGTAETARLAQEAREARALRARVPELEERIRGLEARLREVTAAYDAVLASRSWRLTRPYRQAGRLILGLFRP